MLSYRLRILGSCAIGGVDIFEFYAGEDRILKFQVLGDTGKCPYSVPNTTTKTLYIPATPTDLVIADADIIQSTEDPSIFTVNLSKVQTAAMISGDLRLVLTDTGGNIRIAYLIGAIRKLNVAV